MRLRVHDLLQVDSEDTLSLLRESKESGDKQEVAQRPPARRSARLGKRAAAAALLVRGPGIRGLSSACTLHVLPRGGKQCLCICHPGRLLELFAQGRCFPRAVYRPEGLCRMGHAEKQPVTTSKQVLIPAHRTGARSATHGRQRRREQRGRLPHVWQELRVRWLACVLSRRLSAHGRRACAWCWHAAL